jgi:ankyrin repeat protein
LTAIIAPILFLYVWTHDSVTSAVKAGDHERLAALIKHGHGVGFRSRLTFNGIWDGYTPLHWAAYRHDAVALEMLLRAGANPNAVATWRNITPLHAMLLSGREVGRAGPRDPARCIELLVRAGANVNAQQTEGATALHEAVWPTSCVEIAGALIRNGADPIIEDSQHDAPINRVIFSDNLEMFRAFVENGFDLDRPLTKRGRSTRDFIRASRDMPRIKEYLASLEKGDGGGDR